MNDGETADGRHGRYVMPKQNDEIDHGCTETAYMHTCYVLYVIFFFNCWLNALHHGLCTVPTIDSTTVTVRIAVGYAINFFGD